MENILIIEDNEDVNLMLSKAIKNAGYNVKSSFTGIDYNYFSKRYDKHKNRFIKTWC